MEWRPFAFTLPSPLVSARGGVRSKRGWLLKLETEAGSVGWGEAAPLDACHRQVMAAVAALDGEQDRAFLEGAIDRLPPVLAFAVGAALAEADRLLGDQKGEWLPAPAAAGLLPAGEAAISALERWLAGDAADHPTPTVKWKVAVEGDDLERRVLEDLLDRLPRQARLRLDANGGWQRPTAWAWADRLAAEPRLEWLEQPLAVEDQEGLELLAGRVPVALDESLRELPELRTIWQGWQVRRPCQDGDPRPLLRQLQVGVPRLMLSTAFETGIGRRWLAHLSALQARGPTPAAPGLAPGWIAAGPLFHHDPARVWEAAAWSEAVR
jgi:O-succinylbenzoate synthase